VGGGGRDTVLSTGIYRAQVFSRGRASGRGELRRNTIFADHSPLRGGQAQGGDKGAASCWLGGGWEWGAGAGAGATNRGGGGGTGFSLSVRFSGYIN